MNARYWVVIPAAGAGQRMGAATAKQYLCLAGRTVIEWALAPFLQDARFSAVVVALATDDQHWRSLPVAAHSKIRITQGGAERADSVRAGLASLSNQASAQDWVLVHDAARPCLELADLNKLINTLTANDDEAGGLLATPLADTLKQADAEQRVVTTIPRAGLWRAQTPQMFRYDVLQRALMQAHERGVQVTDEASAVEALGYQPLLVGGRADNLKITVPEDLALAAGILAARTGV
jgi:2-C-methyl-D-erythritol 4-phosphate cytidylyltransferase